MNNERKEIFAVNKSTGEIKKFKSRTECAKTLNSTFSAVIIALRNRGSVKGWKIVSLESLQDDINQMTELLNNLNQIEG